MEVSLLELAQLLLPVPTLVRRRASVIPYVSVAHCFPSTATNAAKSEVVRFAWGGTRATTTSGGGPVQSGAPASTLGNNEAFTAGMRICMYATAMSFWSGSSLGWTSITTAEQTAENGPAWLSSRVSFE